MGAMQIFDVRDKLRRKEEARSLCPCCGGPVMAMDYDSHLYFCFIPISQKVKRKFSCVVCSRRLVLVQWSLISPQSWIYPMRGKPSVSQCDQGHASYCALMSDENNIHLWFADSIFISCYIVYSDSQHICSIILHSMWCVC